jgi:hypothetical protein
MRAVALRALLLVAVAPAAVLATVVPAASAVILANGPGYGSDKQDTADCILYNSGNVAIRISSIQIFQEFGVATLDSSCARLILSPGHDCITSAHLDTGTAYACKAIVTNSTVRGTFEIFDATAHVLYSEPLR